MPKPGLRIVKKTPVLAAVCERCGLEFTSRLPATNSDAISEMVTAFNAHECNPLDDSQNALRVVREATEKP